MLSLHYHNTIKDKKMKSYIGNKASQMMARARKGEQILEAPRKVANSLRLPKTLVDHLSKQAKVLNIKMGELARYNTEQGLKTFFALSTPTSIPVESKYFRGGVGVRGGRISTSVYLDTDMLQRIDEIIDTVWKLFKIKTNKTTVVLQLILLSMPPQVREEIYAPYSPVQ
jgi:hypothetical protein